MNFLRQGFRSYRQTDIPTGQVTRGHFWSRDKDGDLCYDMSKIDNEAADTIPFDVLTSN